MAGILFTPFADPIPLLTPTVVSLASLLQSVSPDPAQSHEPSEKKLSSVDTQTVVAALMCEQYIGSTCAAHLLVRLKDAPVGCTVVSSPDTMRIHRLSLESTLSMVQTNHITDVFVTKTTGLFHPEKTASFSAP